MTMNACILPDQRNVDVAPEETLLSAILRAGIPHAHVCGGKARCSTCRVLVIDGLNHCAPRSAEESLMAERLNFVPAIRLACQTKITGQVRLRRLVLDAQDVAISSQIETPAASQSVGEERQLAVLFADIRGFTAFAEQQLPYDVVHALNRYYGEMGREIQACHGNINSYAGDGLMALFAGKDLAEASEHAVNAGLGMLAAVQRLQAYFHDNYNTGLEIGIGVHCGAAVWGTIGDGNTSTTTVIGDTVNVACRIEAATKTLGVNLLVSAEVFSRLGDRFAARRHDGVALPGKHGTHTLYEITGGYCAATADGVESS
jgi:adenylate cyclase